MTPTYYSQYQQDKILNEQVFKGMRNGIFLDIGAFDGITLSNTYFFERELGWNGICFEPVPSHFDALAKNRSCVCLQGCVAAEDGQREFIEVKGGEALSGFAETFSPQHVQRIEAEVLSKGGSMNRIQVKCYNLNNLLGAHGINRINYCSLDTEGSEMEILKVLDFGRLCIDWFTVENTNHGMALRDFMTAKGYRCVGRACIDDIFVREALIAA